VDDEFLKSERILCWRATIFSRSRRGRAASDKFTMHIGDHEVEAELLDRGSKARGIYDEIVRQHRDPALLNTLGGARSRCISSIDGCDRGKKWR